MSDQDQPRTCNIGFNGLPGSCDLPYGHEGEHRLSGWSPETLDTMPPIYAPDGDAMSDQPLRHCTCPAADENEGPHHVTDCSRFDPHVDQPLRQAVIEAGQKAFQRVTAQPDYPNNGSAADAGWVAAARTALEHVRAQIQGDIDAYNSIQLSEIGFGKVRAWEQCAGYLDAALAQLTPAGEEHD